MWPWGHLAVGYLLYAGFERVRGNGRPAAGATVAVLFGTQFPDLVDKPLAWTFHLLPSGRSLAHSALTTSIICLAVGLYARRHGKTEPAVAFSVGYFSHLVADAVAPFMTGDFRDLAYLGWPLTDLPPADPGIGFVELFANIRPTPYLWVQVALAAVALAVWFHNGRPGLGTLREWLGARRDPPDRAER